MEKLLRHSVLNKFKKPINSAKDCHLLSEEIFISTNRKISSTTLRRFFGLLPSISNISKYNLDTIAIYCGEKDYQSLINNFEKPVINKETKSTHEKTQLQELSNFSLNSIFKKTLGGFNNTIPREDFNKDLNQFLKSNYIIYPVVAPGGYGKTIALAHWVKSLEKKYHEFLFCSASIFIQLISQNSNLKNQINFNINDPKNYFNQLEHNKRFIMVIDSLDDLISNTKKIEHLFSYFNQLIQKYPNQNKIKLIFSVRESLWNKMLRSLLIQKISNTQTDNLIYKLESVDNNFLKLSVSEIKTLFKINHTDKNKLILYDAIPFIMQDIIRIPLNLYFLLELLNNEDTLKIISSNSLNRMYLKKFVFTSKFAENKEDILWKLIELIEIEKQEFSINKNLLKKIFPIHLKRETEFYNAYKELINNNIIHEERTENNYGIYATHVSFKHQNFFYYFSALHQIQIYGNLDYSLLNSICDSNKDSEWKNNVISILYEIAYENENYETLKDFCLLPEEVLSSLAVRFSVGNSFRIRNSIRNKLIERYASFSNGQIYFFEQFVDTNFIVNNYEFRIHEYLKNKQTKESQLFGNTILFLAGFLKMDSLICKEQFEIIESIEPDPTIHPWPIGRKVAYQIAHDYFIDKKNIQDVFGYIEFYLNIAHENSNFLNSALVEMELPIFVSLILVGDYSNIIKLYEKVLTSYNIKIPEELSYSNKYNQNILPFLFSEFAKHKLDFKISDNYIPVLEKTIDSFPSTFDDFQYKIILNYFLSDWYKNIDIKKSKEYHQLALKLSEFAQYDFYKAFLLINNPMQDNKLVLEAKKMMQVSGFSF